MIQKQALLSSLLSRKRTLEGSKINANDLNISHIDESIPISLIAEIQTLYLSNNYLPNMVGLPQFVNLRVLSVANNHIRYYEDLEVLSKLSCLEKLTLDRNPVTYLPYYREYVINLCPKLVLLDECKLDSYESSHSRDDVAKLHNYIDQFALTILRNTMLSHYIMKRLCHETMFTDIFPSYRTIAAQHIGQSTSSTRYVTETPVYIGQPDFVNVKLRILLAGGVLRFLQSQSKYLKQTTQDILRKAHLRCISVMTNQEKRKFMSSPSTRELYWEDLMGECLKKQHSHQLRLVHDIEKMSSAQQGSSRNIDYESKASSTQTKTGFQLQSFIESIQFSTAMDDADIGCGLGAICQSKISLDTKSKRESPPREREYQGLGAGEQNKATLKPKPQEKIKRIVPDIDNENPKSLESVKIADKNSIESTRDDNDQNTLVSADRENVSENRQISVDPKAMSSPTKPKAFISPGAVLDRIKEAVISSRNEMVGLREFANENSGPSLPSRTNDRSHARIRFDDYPMITFPKLPAMSSQPSMQSMRQMVNAAVESLSTIQRQLRIRKKFISTKANETNELELDFENWCNKISSKTNALCVSLSDAITDISELMAKESEKAKSIHVDYLNLKLFQEKVLCLQAQVHAKQQELNKLLKENEGVNAEVTTASMKLDSVCKRLESPETILWIRHQRFARFVERLKDDFDKHEVNIAFINWRDATAWRQQARESNMTMLALQNARLRKLKPLYFRKLGTLLFLRKRNKLSSIYFKNYLLKQHLSRWINWMFIRKFNSNRSLRLVKLKMYISKWRRFCDEEMKVKVWSTYLLLKRSFLAMKGLCVHRKSNKRPPSTSLGGNDNAKHVLSDAAQRLGRRCVVSFFFRRWKSVAEAANKMPLRRHYMRKLFSYMQNVQVHRQFVEFSINYRKQLYFQRLLSSIQAKHMAQRRRISLLLQHFRRRGIRGIEQYYQRRLENMATLCQGMDHYIRSRTAKYFLKLKSSSKKEHKTISLKNYKLRAYFRNWMKHATRRKQEFSAKRQSIRSEVRHSKEKAILDLVQNASASLLRRMKDYQQNCVVNHDDKTDTIASLRLQLEEKRTLYQQNYDECTSLSETLHDKNTSIQQSQYRLTDLSVSSEQINKSLDYYEAEKAFALESNNQIRLEIAAIVDTSSSIDYSAILKDIEKRRVALNEHLQLLMFKISIVKKQSKFEQTMLMDTTQKYLHEASVGLTQAKTSSSGIADILNGRGVSLQDLMKQKAAFHDLHNRLISEVDMKSAKARDLDIEVSQLQQRKALIESQLSRLRESLHQFQSE